MQKTLKFRNFKVVNYHINPMLRSSKVHYKSSDLFSILREHFGKDMNLARIKAMSMMICALCKVQRIAYTKLASAFDSDAEASSSLRRIQRLIAECIINTDLIANSLNTKTTALRLSRGHNQVCRRLGQSKSQGGI